MKKNSLLIVLLLFSALDSYSQFDWRKITSGANVDFYWRCRRELDDQYITEMKIVNNNLSDTRVTFTPTFTVNGEVTEYGGSTYYLPATSSMVGDKSGLFWYPKGYKTECTSSCKIDYYVGEQATNQLSSNRSGSDNMQQNSDEDNAYNQMVDDYNNLNKQVNDYIKAGEYKKAIDALNALKTIAGKVAPEKIAGIDSKIKELQDFQAGNSSQKVNACPEGDKMITDYQRALTDYLRSLSQVMNGVDASDQMLNYSQRLSDISLQMASLGCALTEAQVARFDKLMEDFANSATDISSKSLDEILNDVNKEETQVASPVSNTYPGAYVVEPLPKKNNGTLQGTNGSGAKLNGGVYDGKQY